jgi:hypothetical protein
MHDVDHRAGERPEHTHWTAGRVAFLAVSVICLCLSRQALPRSSPPTTVWTGSSPETEPERRAIRAVQPQVNAATDALNDAGNKPSRPRKVRHRKPPPSSKNQPAIMRDRSPTKPGTPASN